MVAAGNDNDHWIPDGLIYDLIDAADPPWEGMRISNVMPIPDNVAGLSNAAWFAAMVSTQPINRPSPTDVLERLLEIGLPAGQTEANYRAAFACYGY